MSSKFEDFLKRTGLTEEEAMQKLETANFDETLGYENELRKALDNKDYEKLFNLIISNQRDQGDALSFITYHSGLRFYKEREKAPF